MRRKAGILFAVLLLSVGMASASNYQSIYNLFGQPNDITAIDQRGQYTAVGTVYPDSQNNLIYLYEQGDLVTSFTTQTNSQGGIRDIDQSSEWVGWAEANQGEWEFLSARESSSGNRQIVITNPYEPGHEPFTVSLSNDKILLGEHHDTEPDNVWIQYEEDIGDNSSRIWQKTLSTDSDVMEVELFKDNAYVLTHDDPNDEYSLTKYGADRQGEKKWSITGNTTFDPVFDVNEDYTVVTGSTMDIWTKRDREKPLFEASLQDPPNEAWQDAGLNGNIVVGLTDGGVYETPVATLQRSQVESLSGNAYALDTYQNNVFAYGIGSQGFVYQDKTRPDSDTAGGVVYQFVQSFTGIGNVDLAIAGILIVGTGVALGMTAGGLASAVGMLGMLGITAMAGLTPPLVSFAIIVVALGLLVSKVLAVSGGGGDSN